MYNRYVPQDDGTFRKKQIQEQKSSGQYTPQPVTLHVEHRETVEKESVPQEHCEPPQQTPPCRQSIPAGSFLRQLLPKNMDTGDLLIVLLLLLMAGDCAEDKNTALLTLALYLFM